MLALAARSSSVGLSASWNAEYHCAAELAEASLQSVEARVEQALAAQSSVVAQLDEGGTPAPAFRAVLVVRGEAVLAAALDFEDAPHVVDQEVGIRAQDIDHALPSPRACLGGEIERPRTRDEGDGVRVGSEACVTHPRR